MIHDISWVFGWGLIQKIPQKVDFLSKKWGCIQEKPQKLDFSLGLFTFIFIAPYRKENTYD